LTYKAIEQFKKFNESEQHRYAAKFHSWYNGPNKSYINDEENFDVSDKGGMDDLVDFLKGGDPFYFSDPPQDIQQEIMQQFDTFLFEEVPQLQALKKGYEKPISILSAEQVIQILRALLNYKRFLMTLDEKILPEVEKIVKIDFDDEIVGFSNLSRAIAGCNRSITSAVDEIKLYFKATVEASKSETEGANEEELRGTKRRVVSHFEQYVREFQQIGKHIEFINRYLAEFKERLPKKVAKMVKGKTFRKNNMDSFIDAANEVRKSLADWAQYVPVYGSIEMYDSNQPYNSANNLLAYGGVAIDVAMLAAAIKVASVTAVTPLQKAFHIAVYYVVADTVVGGLISKGLEYTINTIGDLRWPEASQLDRLEQKGFDR
jgi:hypothetical protein